MSTPILGEDEIVVSAIRDVLKKYGDCDELSALLHKACEDDTNLVFCFFCRRVLATLRPLATQRNEKALAKFHQLSISILPRLWRELYVELDLPVTKAVTTQSLNLVLIQEKSSAPLQIADKQAVMGSEEENAV